MDSALQNCIWSRNYRSLYLAYDNGKGHFGVENENGGIVKVEAPIHASNVMLIDPKTKKATKVGYEIKDGKKVRVAKKSSTVIA